MIELTLDEIFALVDGFTLRDRKIRPNLAAWWELEGKWKHAAHSLCNKLVWYN
jgi:hypothetical protein